MMITFLIMHDDDMVLDFVFKAHIFIHTDFEVIEGFDVMLAAMLGIQYPIAGCEGIQAVMCFFRI